MARLSSDYERLETGASSVQTPGKRFAWKRFALGAAVVIAVVWVFGPRVPQSLPWGSKGTVLDDVQTTTRSPPASAATPPADHTMHRPPPADPADYAVHNTPPHSPVDHASDVPAPTSFETDPNPAKTVFCTSSHSPSLPLVQYALMIDAGSTGSRIHVYKFNNCGPSPVYEYETFRMTRPGLSAFAGRASEAAASLDVLLDEAVRVVPAGLRACTPVAVKATAGLRLLGAAQSKEILDAVVAHLHAAYPFQLAEDGVTIMDGKDEGVYAWITANYLLNTIRGDSPAGTLSYAVLDLGGASTQIVFEPAFSKPDSALVEGDHKYDLTFGGKKHVLYQHSYLGYGLMRARMHVHQLVDFMASIRTLANTTTSEIVGNPCLAQGTQRVVELSDPRVRTGALRKVTMAGQDIGSFEACNRVVQLVMAKDAICEVKPCSFNGVYQPSLLDTFPTGKILLLSYFYDRLQPLLPNNLHTSTRLTVATVADLAKDVCAGRDVWKKRWGKHGSIMEELEGRPEYCLDLTFIHGLLRLGYEFDDTREMTLGKQISGTELGWCLGATLAMVGGELTCRI